jgi:glycosyltransferase involved in cell wall biosynthesis
VNRAKYLHVIGKSEIEGTRNVFGNSVRIELIPNGQRVSSDDFQPALKSSQRSHFGFLGRLDIHTKGIDILLNGFERLVAKGSNAMLHIGGDGRDFQLIAREIKERGLTNNVLLYGAIFGKEKNHFLSQLNYLCLTSRNEGLPGVVLESLAMNIPCIVSPETNMGEAIHGHDAGFVLEENSAESLARKLEHADNTINTKEYKQRCYNAGRLIEEEFEWSEISERLIQKFYES